MNRIRRFEKWRWYRDNLDSGRCLFVAEGELKIPEYSVVDPICETGGSWVLVGFFVLV